MTVPTTKAKLGQIIGCCKLYPTILPSTPSSTPTPIIMNKRGMSIIPNTASIGIQATLKLGTLVKLSAIFSILRSWAFASNPSPFNLANVHSRCKYAIPSTTIMTLAKIPIHAPANRSVPKAVDAITLCIEGLPGKAVMVKVPAPKATAEPKSLLGRLASRIKVTPSGYMVKITTNITTPP